jgi:hypothetical protein
MLQEKKGKTMTKLDSRRTRRKERISRFGRKWKNLREKGRCTLKQFIVGNLLIEKKRSWKI